MVNKSVDHTLFIRAQKLCSEEQLLIPLKEKKYTLALRRACGGIKYSIVELLLHYNQRRNITIDLNECSISNGYTALDWIVKAKPANAQAVIEQQGIIRLLKDAGAMMAEELNLSATLVAGAQT